MTMNLRNFATLGLAGALLAATAASSAAQELPKTGDFTIYWTHVNPTPFAPVPVGDGSVALALTFISGSVNTDGPGSFLHDARGRCLALQIIDQAAGTFTVQGYCDWQDRAGDHVFETFWSDGVTPFGGNTYGRFVGGTGKYEGISGEVTITAYGGTTTSDGYGQAIGVKVGSYQIP
jgi:hypothetical protein